MTWNKASTAWSAPFIVLAPFVLAHCSGGTGGSDPSDAATGVSSAASSDDAAQKAPPDSGMKSPPDSGMKGPPADASQPMAPDAGSSPPDSGMPPPANDGATTTPPPDSGANPDAGRPPSTPGTVMCNGAPCDVSKGNFCCVTRSDGGVTESCKPPLSTCPGFTVDCDEAADCAHGGVCCQDFPSAAVAGSASCKAACPTQICRTDDECCPFEGDGGHGNCMQQECTNDSPFRSLVIFACEVHGFSPLNTISSSCRPMQ